MDLGIPPIRGKPSLPPFWYGLGASDARGSNCLTSRPSESHVSCRAIQYPRILSGTLNQPSRRHAIILSTEPKASSRDTTGETCLYIRGLASCTTDSGMRSTFVRSLTTGCGHSVTRLRFKFVQEDRLGEEIALSESNLRSCLQIR
jgi:hypothetical protein